MNAPRVPKLDPGHWLTIITVVVQFAALVAVINWRMGEVERQVRTLDERLWQHMTVPPARAAALRFCPPDASAWTLARTP